MSEEEEYAYRIVDKQFQDWCESQKRTGPEWHHEHEAYCPECEFCRDEEALFRDEFLEAGPAPIYENLVNELRDRLHPCNDEITTVTRTETEIQMSTTESIVNSVLETEPEAIRRTMGSEAQALLEGLLAKAVEYGRAHSGMSLDGARALEPNILRRVDAMNLIFDPSDILKQDTDFSSRRDLEIAISWRDALDNWIHAYGEGA